MTSDRRLDERWSALHACYAEQMRICQSSSPDLGQLGRLSRRCESLLLELTGPAAPQPENETQRRRLITLAKSAHAHLESSKATLLTLRTRMVQERANAEKNALAVRAYLGMAPRPPRRTFKSPG